MQRLSNVKDVLEIMHTAAAAHCTTAWSDSLGLVAGGYLVHIFTHADTQPQKHFCLLLRRDLFLFIFPSSVCGNTNIHQTPAQLLFKILVLVQNMKPMTAR